MSKNTSYLNSTSLLSELVTIKGDIDCGGDIRIDGNVSGNIFCKGKLVIGNNSKVVGNIDASVLDNNGDIVGDVKISESVNLRAKSSLKGDISLVSANLQIEETAIFNGACSMVTK